MAQEPRAESSAPASARPEGTAVPVEPASAAPWTGGEAAAENSGETRIPDKEWIEARHTAAKEAAASDDPASKALEDRYQEALDLYKTIEAQRALLDSYAAALTSAPEATNEARATMEATPQAESGADHGDRPPPSLSSEASVDDINNRLAAAREVELEAKQKLEHLEANIALQQTRPDAIRDRISTIQKGISAAEAESAELDGKADATELDQASLLRARLQAEAFEAELAALE